jgi:hypothetical protein
LRLLFCPDREVILVDYQRFWPGGTRAATICDH